MIPPILIFIQAIRYHTQALPKHQQVRIRAHECCSGSHHDLDKGHLVIHALFQYVLHTPPPRHRHPQYLPHAPNPMLDVSALCAAAPDPAPPVPRTRTDDVNNVITTRAAEVFRQEMPVFAASQLLQAGTLPRHALTGDFH
jgi:hypothetical protein